MAACYTARPVCKPGGPAPAGLRLPVLAHHRAVAEGTVAHLQKALLAVTGLVEWVPYFLGQGHELSREVVLLFLPRILLELFWGGGSSIKPRACSFKSNVRAAMSLSRPAPLRQFQSWHR